MKRILCLLALTLLMSVTGCAKTPVDSPDDFYYAADLKKRIPGDFPLVTRIPGMAEGHCLPNPNDSTDADSVNAAYAGLFAVGDLKTVFQKLPTEKMYPASMTKMMTALVVLESGVDLSEQVPITADAFADLTSDASIAYLHEGCTYSVSDLLVGLLIPSGNDAGNALAIHVSGSIPAFVQKMNEKAKELGMFNTHYDNPHGLHTKNHYTTVYDMYLLAEACAKQDLFLQISAMKTAEVICHNPDGSVTGQSYTATNSFVRGFVKTPAGVTFLGGKTGYTKEAGRCLTVIARGESGNLYVAVVGKVNGYEALYTEMSNLLKKIPEYENGR